MIKLNPNRLLVRWFLASLDMIGKFLDSTSISSENAEKGTNLCGLVQISVVGLALGLFHAVVLIAAVWYVIIHPFRVFGWWMVGVGLTTTALIGGAVYLLILGWRFFREEWEKTWEKFQDNRYKRQAEREYYRLNEEAAACMQPIVEKGPSVFALAREWIVAIKHQFCPQIAWVAPLPEERTRAPWFILNGGQFLVLAFLALVLAAVLHLLPYAAVQVEANFSVSTEAVCSFTKADNDPPNLKVILNCGGVPAWSDTHAVAAYFLNNREASSSLTCKVYKDEEAECVVPEKLESAK